MAAGEVVSFWDFSVELYARPGVADACLALQDEDGRDVTLALCCLYAGAVLGRRLAPDDLARLAAAAEPWNAAAVRPLRALRRDLKAFDGEPAAAAVRRQVQAAELAAEQVSQARLAEALGLAPAGPGDRRLGSANLRLYAGKAARRLLASLGWDG